VSCSHAFRGFLRPLVDDQNITFNAMINVAFRTLEQSMRIGSIQFISDTTNGTMRKRPYHVLAPFPIELDLPVDTDITSATFEGYVQRFHDAWAIYPCTDHKSIASLKSIFVQGIRVDRNHHTRAALAIRNMADRMCSVSTMSFVDMVSGLRVALDRLLQLAAFHPSHP
jgi:hypothetical protein